MSNVLQAIVENKKAELVERKRLMDEQLLSQNLTVSNRSLFQSLSNSKADFILECKKASPSRGLIRDDFNLEEIVSVYSKYASAISVLTDQKYFQGSFDYLNYVSTHVEQPVLAKDFFIDPYQVIEARYHGADAILLMLSVLNDEQYRVLASKAESLNLDILTEVHDSEEMQRAIELDAKIIGINNRNLKDLSISLDTTHRLIAELSEAQKQGRVFISESGISNAKQVRELAPFVNGFLIGSSIMAQPDIERQCKQLLYGQIKVCGIKEIDIAQTAYNNGAIYGGLIFYPKSPRSVSVESAQNIVSQVPLNWVGVFVNAEINQVVQIAQQLALSAVQLHGEETIEYIQALKQKLPSIEIWKAVSISADNQEAIEAYMQHPMLDKLLFDTTHNNQRGGTGKSFDWALIASLAKQNIVLAGGISADNVLQALQTDCPILDVNSGVEKQVGVKSKQKIASFFQTLRV